VEKQHYEEFNDMYSSSNIFRVNVPGKTRLGHVARMGETRGSY
jgi:hypothetical protein